MLTFSAPLFGRQETRRADGEGYRRSACLAEVLDASWLRQRRGLIPRKPVWWLA
jgi:hypothetical protein